MTQTRRANLQRGRLAVTGALALVGLCLPATAAHAHGSSATTVRCHGRVATIVGTPGDDVLHGGPGNDVIVGLDGSDRIDGRGGDDVICGGDGHSDDSLHGGPGNDWLDGGEGSHDFLSGGPGRDHLRSDAHRANLAGGPGDDVEVARRVSDWVHFVSETGNDVFRVRLPTTQARFELVSSPVGVRLDATAGTLRGRGRTTLDLAPGSTVWVVGSEHDDVLRGTAGDDRIEGEVGDDRIRTAAGNDTATGGPGDNVIHTGPGNDLVLPDRADSRGPSFSTVYGGSGDDILEFDRTNRVHGEKGDDLLRGVLVPGAPEVADGGAGHNTLYLALPMSPSGQPWQHALVDLLHGRLDADGSVTHFSGLFTDLLVVTHETAMDWAVKGTNQADDLAVFDAAGQQVVMEGRAGDDLLRTGSGDDVLRGGAGSDQGQAGGGTDACFSIEQPVDCEATSP